MAKANELPVIWLEWLKATKLMISN